MRLLTTLSLLLLVAPCSWAQVNSISQLNKKIKSAGAAWTAGDTSVSHLSMQEFKAMLDPSLDRHPEVQFEIPDEGVVGTMATTVTAWDWRNKDGKNWLSPIRNQNSCGSCLAFAAAATVETQSRISQGKSSLGLRLSPQFIFSCGGGKCNRGWYPDMAADFLKKTGIVDEACMPYASSSGSDISCKRACSNANNRTVKISSYSSPTDGARSLAALRSALQKGPLVTTMSVYNDFMNYRRGIYKHVSGAYAGGHAIVIVGFNDKDRYLVIRNSWGTSWGESGYARISYDDASGIGAATWKYEVAKPSVFELPLLNARLAEPETINETIAVREPANFQSAEPDFALTAEVRSREVHPYVLQLENRGGPFVGPVQFHQVRKGSEKIVTTKMNGRSLKTRINTALLEAGDWEFYFSANDSLGRPVETERYRITVEP